MILVIAASRAEGRLVITKAEKIRGRKRIKQSRKIYSMGGCERYQVRSLILCIIKGEDWRFMKELFAPRLAKCLDMNCSVFE